MFCSIDIEVFCIFKHPEIYYICDIIMIISTWDRVHFWIYLLGWLAHLVSRFACNTRVIVDESSIPPVSRIKIAVTKTLYQIIK